MQRPAAKLAMCRDCFLNEMTLSHCYGYCTFDQPLAHLIFNSPIARLHSCVTGFDPASFVA
jgi:hypothetical protein